MKCQKTAYGNVVLTCKKKVTYHFACLAGMRCRVYTKHCQGNRIDGRVRACKLCVCVFFSSSIQYLFSPPLTAGGKKKHITFCSAINEKNFSYSLFIHLSSPEVRFYFSPTEVRCLRPLRRLHFQLPFLIFFFSTVTNHKRLSIIL